ncbi:Bile salt-activated lipase [Dissostichus eleginoides]|uniref:Bile salt-activated lipase n=1 Tax=Dissostichus eleginoides TaxID=100907 RepID=A0AAD9CF94_DISEL|nr:Bile salt-activated lipase [Dissostichus eleginoides]
MLIKTRIDNEQKYVKISEPRMDEFLNSAFIKFSIPPVSEGIRVYDETGPEVDADVFEEVAQLPNAASKGTTSSASLLLDELTNSALEPLACSSNDTFMEDESPSRKRQKTDDDAKRDPNMHPSFIETEGKFITKPADIANHFNDHFTNKVDKLRNAMGAVEDTVSHHIIKDRIMREKQCMFEFHNVTEDDVENMLLHLSDDKSPGIDNLDGKLLKMTAKYISKPLSHIFNKSLEQGVCPEIWKEAKVIPLPKDKRKSFAGSNSRPIRLLPGSNSRPIRLLPGSNDRPISLLPGSNDRPIRLLPGSNDRPIRLLPGSNGRPIRLLQVPMIDLSGSSQVPMVDLSGSSQVPMIDLSGSSEVPMIDLSGSSQIPMIDLSGSSQVPMIDLSGSSQIPMIDLSGSSQVPMIDLSGSSQVPMIDLSGSSQVPMIDLSGSSQIPMIDLSGSSQVPMIDLSGSSQIPMIDLSGSSQVPMVDLSGSSQASGQPQQRPCKESPLRRSSEVILEWMFASGVGATRVTILEWSMWLRGASCMQIGVTWSQPPIVGFRCRLGKLNTF